MSTRDRIVERLRTEPAHLSALVELVITEALERPLAELVEPSWLASALADGVRQAAASDDLEVWVRGRVENALTRADRIDGTLADHMPVTLLSPLETMLGRDLTPDRDLVRALLDHPSLRDLIAAILQANILEFGRKLRTFVPDGGSLPGAKLRSRLAGVAKGVASAVGSEMERQLEDRVRTFVDDALGRAVDMAIERFSSPEFASEMARWRVDVLHALMRHPLDELVAERYKYPPETFAADATALLRALAGWKQLNEVLERGLERAIEEFGDQSAAAFLEGSGLEKAWRPQLAELMHTRLSAVVETEAFADWVAGLVDE